MFNIPESWYPVLAVLFFSLIGTLYGIFRDEDTVEALKTDQYKILRKLIMTQIVSVLIFFGGMDIGLIGDFSIGSIAIAFFAIGYAGQSILEGIVQKILSKFSDNTTAKK